MTDRITVGAIIELLKPHQNITWVAGNSAASRDVTTDTGWGNHPQIVGHLNLINPYHVQILGNIEMEYINTLSSTERENALQKLFGSGIFAVIVTDKLAVPNDFRSFADENAIALLSSPLPSNELLTHIRYKLNRLLGKKQVLHGVFMEVISLGVLLTGESSIGKSELALELITRGHRLIADDAPEFVRISPDIISGNSPKILQDLLEVRGLGILNIRQMYGDSALKDSKYLRLIINLVPTDKKEPPLDRLNSNNTVQNIMGVDIVKITLQVAPGRNIAVMVEAAARNYLVQTRGYNPNQELIKRQSEQLNQDSS